MSWLEQIRRLDAAHHGVPIELNFDILFGQCRIGDLNFAETYKHCLAVTDTRVGDGKIFLRALRAYNLALYFDYALKFGGPWVECGVYRGFSALLLAKVARMCDAGFSGTGLHLIDSFEGLSELTFHDYPKPRKSQEGPPQPKIKLGPPSFKTSVERVRGALGEFPDTAIHKGWIPEVFGGLPDAMWSFVHVDVDLYEPTLACLEYFVPRLAPGGVIINDDYGSPLLPGAGRAWDLYFEAFGLPFFALDGGQSVFIRTK